MMKIGFLVLLLVGCDRLKPTYHGIPAGVEIECGYATDRVRTCVAGGRVYTCVETGGTAHACAPNVPAAPEAAP